MQEWAHDFYLQQKANPKEMLSIVDKPLIQYATEEAVNAGIEILIFITGRNKVSIPNHFDKAYEIETEFERKNKRKELDLVQNIVPSNVKCIYIRQNQALRFWPCCALIVQKKVA